MVSWSSSSLSDLKEGEDDEGEDEPGDLFLHCFLLYFLLLFFIHLTGEREWEICDVISLFFIS